jgi:adenosine deaminase CECR1
VDLINRTAMYRVARRLPKGAHLHIHFNACLPPSVLLNIAKSMDRMFISSDLPLVANRAFESYAKCEIQFCLLSPEKESPGNLFSADYQPRQTMKLQDFLQEFPRHCDGRDGETWLQEKLVFQEEETHNSLQTAEG